MHRTLRPFELLEPETIAEAARSLSAHQGKLYAFTRVSNLVEKQEGPIFFGHNRSISTR